MQAVCVCRFVSGNDNDEGRVRLFPPLHKSACWLSLTLVDVGMSRRAAKVSVSVSSERLGQSTPDVVCERGVERRIPSNVLEATPFLHYQ